MIKNNEPFLIEFNVRMGDPECQVILPRLQTDLLKIFKNVVDNKLKNIKLKWSPKKCMTIVLCTKGYPGKYKKNILIKNLEKIKIKKDTFIFHAGTKADGDKILTNGGRVLNVVGSGNSLQQAIDASYEAIQNIRFEGSFYRKDIGAKGLKRLG